MLTVLLGVLSRVLLSRLFLSVGSALAVSGLSRARRGRKKVFVNSKPFIQQRLELFIDAHIAKVNVTFGAAFAETGAAYPVIYLNLSRFFTEKRTASKSVLVAVDYQRKIVQTFVSPTRLKLATIGAPKDAAIAPTGENEA